MQIPKAAGIQAGKIDKTGEVDMKQSKYSCNICGKEIRKSGQYPEDSLYIEKEWGYFSDKDGERHIIRMCENCYDMWIKSFHIPPHVEEVTEILNIR